MLTCPKKRRRDFCSVTLPEKEERLAQLSDEECADLLRLEMALKTQPTTPDVFQRGEKSTWLVMAGRGFGKTRVGAEWVREQVKTSEYVNLIGATASDARDIMVEGESGVLKVCRKEEKPEYIASKRQLQWPNGAISLIFTADEPERLRGKQHMKIWADELGSWRYSESVDQAMFGFRLVQIRRSCYHDAKTHETR